MRKALLLSFSLSFILLYTGCSSDTENNLQTIENPANESSSLPRLYTDDTGTVFMSWVEEQGKMATLNYATFAESSWSDAETITSDSTWFLNWADFPSVIAREGEPVAAHWLQKIPGNTYSYNIELATYQDSWSDEMLLHTDGTATEHGFVSMTPAGENRFLATWLDGRNTANRDENEYSDMSKAMTLRAAFVDYTKNTITEKFKLDSTVCDCCTTAISKTGEDSYIVVYRDRTADEIRDIYYTLFNGSSWTEPQPVSNDGWKIAGCPVNGPAVAAKDGKVAVAWFTGADNKPIVKMAISDNNGQDFKAPVVIDQDSPTGRTDLNISGKKIWLSWIGEYNEGPSLIIKSYDYEGIEIEAFHIPFSDSRSSGFPQITPYQNGLLVAYTDQYGLKPVIRTALIK